MTGALVRAPGEVTTSQDVSLVSTGGTNDERKVVATSASTLADLDLFGSVNIGVSKRPTLTATATGKPGGADVSYNEPVVTVTVPNRPEPFVLDVANETATFVLPRTRSSPSSSPWAPRRTSPRLLTEPAPPARPRCSA